MKKILLPKTLNGVSQVSVFELDHEIKATFLGLNITQILV